MSDRDEAVRPIPVDEIDPSPYADLCPSDAENVEALARDMRKGTGEVLNPLHVVEKPDERFELLAGHDRLAAAKRVGLDEVPVRVFKIEDKEARISHLLRENALRKTTPKRPGVEWALKRHADWSNRRLADFVGVTPQYVGKVRRDLEKAGTLETVSSRVGVDGREIETGGIGRDGEPESDDVDEGVADLVDEGILDREDFADLGTTEMRTVVDMARSAYDDAYPLSLQRLHQRNGGPKAPRLRRARSAARAAGRGAADALRAGTWAGSLGPRRRSGAVRTGHRTGVERSKRWSDRAEKNRERRRTERRIDRYAEAVRVFVDAIAALAPIAGLDRGDVEALNTTVRDAWVRVGLSEEGGS